MSKNSTKNTSSVLLRSAFGVIAGAMMLTTSFDASAQVVYSEGFDQSPTPSYTLASNAPYTANYTTLFPAGWISGKWGAGTDIDNRWDRTRYSTAPTCTARTGSGMIRFISDAINSGEASFISSRRLDYQAWTAGVPTASFYMYREVTLGNDNVKVFASNHPDPSLATALIPLSPIQKNNITTTKTGSGVSLATTITVSDTVGLTNLTGMYVTGTGIGAGATIVSFPTSTSITLSVANAGAVSGTLTFGLYGVTGNTILRMPSTAGVTVGMFVWGSNFGGGAVVNAVTATTVTLSAANTGDITGVFYFSPAMVNRFYNIYPATASYATLATTYTSSAWNNYSFNVPMNEFPASSRDSLYIVFIATSGLGNNIYIDDFSVTHYPKLMTYTKSAMSFQNTATTAAGATNQLIGGGYVRVEGEGTPFTINNITWNWNGTTSPSTDIQNARLWYTGGSNFWDPNIAIVSAPIANPSVSSNMTWTAPITLVHGDNYFWVTYDIKGTAISGNCVDAEFTSFDLQRTKNPTTGAAGSALLTVSDTTGLIPGMAIVGQASSLTISSLTGLTSVTMNNTLPVALSGAQTFYLTVVPNPPNDLNPPTLAGCRLIDFLYCVANMTAGTSWAGYTRNDYVSAVVLDGENTATNGIYTGRMWLPPGQVSTCNATPNFNLNPPGLGDCSGSSVACGPYAGTGAWANSSCPFTTHPPDYELMPQVPGRTTSMISNGSNQYTLKVWAGTWYGANYTAAWLDLNKNGTLSDSLLLTTYNGNPGTATAIVIPTVNASVTNTITLQANWTGFANAFAAGRPIWGPGIPSGTTIVSWTAPATLVLSQAVNVVAGSPIYTGQVGGEKIFQSNSLANGGAFMVSGAGFPYGTGGVVFTLPPNSATGLMRLRVREVYASSNISSCGNYTWGETEDYIVTIIPPCDVTAYGAPAGYDKVWLGFTDDWDNPLNWCPTGVPTIGDDAFIPPYTGASVAPYRPGNKHPLIKPGVYATTARLRIADSLSVNAYTNSSLTMSDSLIIQGSKVMRVISDYRKDIKIGIGTLVNNFAQYGLFQDGTKTRALLTYQPIDFTGQGVLVGDLIDTLLIPYQRLGNNWVTSYTNVTVRWSTIGPGSFLPGGFTLIPAYLTGPTTLFSGTVNSLGTLATAFDTLKIPLSSPWVFPNVPLGNQIMLEIITDNNTAIVGGLLDSKCTLTPTGSTYCVVYSTSTALPPGSMAPNAGQLGVAHVTSNKRPNIYFRSRRAYMKYPIEARKNWINDGTFTSGTSIVTMKGVVNQLIGGASQTAFYDLVIDNGAHVRRKTDFSIADSLNLKNGWLQLDSGTVTLLNPAITGLTRTNGYLNSETAPAGGIFYGNFRWNMTGATVPSLRTIPFINNASVPIPVTYNMDAGSHDVTFATYATNAANAPLPVHAAGPPGPVVSNVNGYSTGTDNSGYMVDRYWKVYNSTPAGATSDLTISWSAAENAALGGPAAYSGQRWVDNANSTTAGPGWEYPYVANQAPAATSVTINDFNLFNSNIWWAVVRETNPLPVELLNFTAKPVGSRVRLNWATASEINNDKFVVERTVNMNDWSFIDDLKSRGNSSITQTYETWDENPVNGMQYYMLRQYDIGGRLTSYGPVAVDMTRKVFGIVSASVQSSAQGITLIFNYDSNEPYSVEVIDMLGRVVGASSNNPASPGLNVMDIKADMSSGVYQIILRNSTQVDTKKIFY